jgi:pimeloyl-ACP methyl ester carboxylesterase
MAQHTHEWFNPVVKFGPVIGVKGKSAPLLLYLPGNDGSGLTPVMQFPELASAFEIQCLSFEGRDRSNFTQIKAIVKAKLREAKMEGREVYLMGESFGGIVALSMGMDDSDPALMPDRIILVNAASCFDRTPLGKASPWLVKLPEPFFTLAVFPVVFLMFDADMFRNMGKAVVHGHVPGIIRGEDRQAFVKRVFPKVMQKMQLRSDDLKWRIKNWVLPGCHEVNPKLKDVKVPVLAVAGTSDLLLPSLEEALKFKDEIPQCTLRLVEGAGHAGVLDQRADLLEMIRSCWSRAAV